MLEARAGWRSTATSATSGRRRGPHPARRVARDPGGRRRRAALPLLLRARRTRTRTRSLSELLEAVYRGDEARVEELLAGEPELDIFEAAAVGRSERVERASGRRSRAVSAWAEDGFTPLHLAAFFRRPETARLLVERGALVDVVARNEQLQVTPLQSAAAAARGGDGGAPARARRGSERPAAGRVHGAACGRPARRRAVRRSCCWRTARIRRSPPTTAARPPISRATAVTRSSLPGSRALTRAGLAFRRPGPPRATTRFRR